MSGRWKLVQLPPLTHESIQNCGSTSALRLRRGRAALRRRPHGRLPGASDARPSRYRTQYCLANVSRRCPRAATFASIISVFIWVRRDTGLALPVRRAQPGPQPIFRSCPPASSNSSVAMPRASSWSRRSRASGTLVQVSSSPRQRTIQTLFTTGSRATGRRLSPGPERVRCPARELCLARCRQHGAGPHHGGHAPNRQRGEEQRLGPEELGSAPRLWQLPGHRSTRRMAAAPIVKVDGLSHGPCPFRGAGQLTGRLPSGSAAPAAGLPRTARRRRRR